MSRIDQEQEQSIFTAETRGRPKGVRNRRRKAEPRLKCEHNEYFTVCGKHPKIFARGLSEEDYQFMLNFKAKIAYKNGFDKNISWRFFFHLLPKELRDLYPYERDSHSVME